MNEPSDDLAAAVRRLRPWYHDFSSLGLRTDFESTSSRARTALRSAASVVWDRLRSRRHVEDGARLPLLQGLLRGRPSHRLNQTVKEEVLFPMIDRALAEATSEETTRFDVLDLFCSDGYYACWIASRYPSARVTAVDLDPAQVERGRLAAEALGLADRIELVAADAAEFLEQDASQRDLILCAGGLYHLSDPRSLLDRLTAAAPRSLVLQTVVTLTTEDPDYFVTPAPGWVHGCRFTHAGLESWLEGRGWALQEVTRNQLPGNRQAKDRGSSYIRASLPDHVPGT